ncbi:GCN5 family acetyltransferase [Burkholderia ubonensis]|uniref:GNAT family N-acetyltransferase n=1 Tax=Burkholderia ubonensis TaxID=101571 RepID=UPI00075C66A4|nr:GNAT family N-acetyltransferase [Burkholderia ubonensis]KVP88932.1 GCN5 family acetyltransferase [Burkholderia ubonensis]
MSKRHAVATGQTPFTRVKRGVGSVVLRRIDLSLDSYEEIITMPHRACADFGTMEPSCPLQDRSSAITRRRVRADDCFVAVRNGQAIGTVTLVAPDIDAACEHHRRHNVAVIGQLAVDPSWQNRGIGKSLLAFAEHWAATRDYVELSIDVPDSAERLISFYQRQGFRRVDVVRFAGRRYDSAILSKAPVIARTLAAWTHRVALHGTCPVHFAT